MVTLENVELWLSWVFFAGLAMGILIGVGLTAIARAGDEPVLRKGRVQPLFAEPSAQTVRQKRGGVV